MKTAHLVEKSNRSYPGEFQKVFSSFENSYSSKQYYIKLVKLNNIGLILNFLSFYNIFSTFDVLHAQEVNDTFLSTIYGGLSKANILLSINSIFAAMLMVTEVFVRKAELEFEIKKGKSPQKYGFFCRENLMTFFLFQLIYICHPNYFFQNTNIINHGNIIYINNLSANKLIGYSFNDIISLLSLLKIIPIYLLMMKSVSYNSDSADRICRINGFNKDASFGLKCIFKNNPIKLLIITFFLNDCIFAVGIRFCEYESSVNGGNYNLSYYFNCIWFVGVTMTTVGYGDYVPNTQMGRFFSFLVAIWGVLFISIGFVSLTNLIKLSIQEQNALSIVKKLSLKRQKKESAAKIIANFFRLLLARKRAKNGCFGGMRYVLVKEKLFKSIVDFKQNQINLKYVPDENDFMLYLLYNMDFVNDSLKEIERNQKYIFDKAILLKDHFLVQEALRG